MLDQSSTKLRLQCLHVHEHDVPEADAQRLRNGCDRRPVDVRALSGSQLPSALVDWNNNYGDDEDKCVLFHCGNWPVGFAPDTKIANAPILGSTLGVENTYGAMEGRAPEGR